MTTNKTKMNGTWIIVDDISPYIVLITYIVTLIFLEGFIEGFIGSIL